MRVPPWLLRCLFVQPTRNRINMSKNLAAVLPPTGSNTQPFRFPATCTSAGFRTDHQPSTIDHQPISFSFPCAKASHKSSAHIYVTLHDLHDSKGRVSETKNVPPSTINHLSRAPRMREEAGSANNHVPRCLIETQKSNETNALSCFSLSARRRSGERAGERCALSLILRFCRITFLSLNSRNTRNIVALQPHNRGHRVLRCFQWNPSQTNRTGPRRG
jgi:hypothetical protein